MSEPEKTKLNRDQNRASRDIYRQRHDAQVNPNPNSPIDQWRANQEARIAAGVRDGSLTPGEAGRLQGQQASIPRHQKCRLGRAVAFSSKHPRPVNRMKYEYWVVFLLLRPDR